jgi:hypothetical protein
MRKLIYRMLLGASFVVGVAQADTKLDEAKAHLQAGTALYDDNDFRGALVEFQRAYELTASYKILFNIAQVEMQLHDYAGALKTYTRYVTEGGPDIAPARLTHVNVEIERLRGRVGFLIIQTAGGAQVLIDDALVGYAPLPERVAVAAGQHRVTIEIAGREPISRVFDVPGRQSVTATLAVEGPVVPLVAPSPPVPPPAAPPSTIPVYVAWSVTGGLAIGAGVFGLIARSNAKELATLRATYQVDPDQLAAQRAKTVRNAVVTDVLTGTAMASAGVALYLTLTRMGEPSPSKERAVQLQIAPAGVAIAGRF